MAKGYKVCWWFPAKVDIKHYGKQRKPTCRTLSAKISTTAPRGKQPRLC